MSFQLTHTKIRVEGNDEDIIFSNLMVNQQLANVNSFHFTWLQPGGEPSLSSQVSFYTDNLSKEVTITIGDDFSFKGIIYAISCNNRDSLGVSYEISGKGMFEKLNQVPECRSFYKKSLKDIFNTVNSTSGTTLNLSPSNTSELFYSVQYNQTAFAFLSMMAARYGEWFYYNGAEMVLEAPSGDAITLNQGQDVHQIDISAKIVRPPMNNSSFNRHSGEVLTHQAQAGNATGFLGASQHAGETAYGSNQSMTHISAAATQQLLTDISTLSQKASVANAVILRAQGNSSKIKLAAKIKLMDEGGNSNGEYIITEVHHSCSNEDNYQNQFIAVPAEVEVPPYTNPFLVTPCKAQPATVVKNDDADGLDRIKVHFPWQQSGENTPWLNVVTPHAGKGKGIRFLPEEGEEVLVDFLDNNAERPFVLGAIHTEQNKSGNDATSNNLKIIGTRTGRRIEFDDDKGLILIRDFDGDAKGNSLKFQNNKDNTIINMSSGKDAKNFSSFQLAHEELAFIGIMKDGEFILSISLDEKKKSIKIKSKGSISLSADSSINLSAGSININASQELNLEGKSKGTNIKGQKVTVDAKTDVEVKGINASVEGTAKLDLKGGATSTLKGGIVQIN